jgi:hypothetical protein
VSYRRRPARISRPVGPQIQETNCLIPVQILQLLFFPIFHFTIIQCSCVEKEKKLHVFLCTKLSAFSFILSVHFFTFHTVPTGTNRCGNVLLCACNLFVSVSKHYFIYLHTNFELFLWLKKYALI